MVCLVSVYLPARGSSSSFSDYCNTLGELHGFIASQAHDVLLIAGDFNVDFNRSCSLHPLLVDFLSELDLAVCDLSFESSVGFTFEGSQGFPPSWIDHILCSSPHSALVMDVFS